MPSTENFDFHYKKSPTGELSGPSFAQQTEDAINDVGQYAKGAYDTSASSDSKAQQAMETAQTALSNANNATAIANSAKEKTDTLEVTVNSWEGRVQNALTTSQAAVETANTAASFAGASASAAAAAQEAAEEALSSAQTAQQNAASSATAAGAAQTASETAQTAAQEAQQLAQQAQQQAQEAQLAAEEASLNSNIIHAYDGTLTNDGHVAIEDLVPATGQQQDLVVDNTGLIYQITAVNEGQATVLQTGATLTGFISYSQAQTLTDKQKSQARSNLDGVSQTELMSILNEYIDGTQTNDIQS